MRTAPSRAGRCPRWAGAAFADHRRRPKHAISPRVKVGHLATFGAVARWPVYREQMSDEVRDEVRLTNLDQPLFDDAGATKRDLVDYLDAVHSRLVPELRDRPLSVIRVRPGPGTFHAKKRPAQHAAVGRDPDAVGADVEAGRVVRALQRSPHPVVAGEPALGRVSPDAGTSRTLGSADVPRHGH